MPSDSSKAATIVGNGAINCANSCDDGLINSGDGPGLVNNNPSAAGFYSGPLPATTSELFGGYYGSSKGFLTNSGGGLICVQYTKYFQYGNGQSTVGAFTTALHTGWNLPSKLLGEVDRRTDDGNAVTGKIRNSTLFTDWRNCWGGIAGV